MKRSGKDPRLLEVGLVVLSLVLTAAFWAGRLVSGVELQQQRMIEVSKQIEEINRKLDVIQRETG